MKKLATYNAQFIDPISFVASCASTIKLARLEKLLNYEGYSLGYKPTLENVLTLRQALDERIPNQYARKYGEIDDICLSLKAVRHGKAVETKRVPRAATGPDFKKIFIGSGSKYGRILEVTLRIIPLPKERSVLEIHWKGAGSRRNFLKLLDASGVRPVFFEKKGGRKILIHIEGTEEGVQAEGKCLKVLARETAGSMTGT